MDYIRFAEQYGATLEYKPVATSIEFAFGFQKRHMELRWVATDKYGASLWRTSKEAAAKAYCERYNLLQPGE